jgi:hypothetical protein
MHNWTLKKWNNRSDDNSLLYIELIAQGDWNPSTIWLRPGYGFGA